MIRQTFFSFLTTKLIVHAQLTVLVHLRGGGDYSEFTKLSILIRLTLYEFVVVGTGKTVCACVNGCLY